MPPANDAPAPHPVGRRDLAALVGMLATLEGELLSQEISPHLVGRLSQRLARVGLLEPGDDTGRSLSQALSDLGHRLRYALGEYPEPPN